MSTKRKTFVIAVQTTNATPALSSIYTPAIGAAVYLEVSIIANAAGVNFAKYNRTMLAQNDSGTAIEQLSTVGTDYETTAGLDGTLVLVGDVVTAQVTGLAATTIDWIITGWYITVP